MHAHAPDLQRLTDAVIAHADLHAAGPRLHHVYASLVRHLHGFVREVRPSDAEVHAARGFIEAVVRGTPAIPGGELHMLTDLLGVSSLVERIADDAPAGATERNLEGPLHVADAPWRAMGDALGVDPAGEPLQLRGRVFDACGRPLAGAVLDVWQAASNGRYDTQDPRQPRGNFRGRFRTGADGRYAFTTVVPAAYRVPDDGPCGALLRRLGRHPWRAGHLHFKLDAPGAAPLTTQLFLADDPWIDSDTTFAVRASKLQLRPAFDDHGRRVHSARFDFVLVPKTVAAKGATPADDVPAIPTASAA